MSDLIDPDFVQRPRGLPTGPPFRSPVELCACGHENDHRGRKCRHESCPCEEGVRVDVASFRVQVDLARLLDRNGKQLAQIGSALTRILGIIEAVSGLQSKLVPQEGGGVAVEIQPATQQGGGIIVPGR